MARRPRDKITAPRPKAANNPRGRGKTVTITKANIKEIERMAGLGLTMEEMAYVLGFSGRTLDRHRKKNSDIEEAIKKGKAVAHETVARVLYSLCVEDRHPPSVAFYLKTRCNWREVHRTESKVEVTGKDQGPVTFKFSPEEMTDEELRKAASG